jgi:hypothetical protein
MSFFISWHRLKPPKRIPSRMSHPKKSQPLAPKKMANMMTAFTFYVSLRYLKLMGFISRLI